MNFKKKDLKETKKHFEKLAFPYIKRGFSVPPHINIILDLIEDLEEKNGK